MSDHPCFCTSGCIGTYGTDAHSHMAPYGKYKDGQFGHVGIE